MHVSVKTLNGLEREIIVSVPADKIEEKVAERLRDLAPKAKIHGFRQGKVPMQVIKNRYSDDLRYEVTRDMVQPTLYDALLEVNLIPAAPPRVEPSLVEAGKDFQYTATFEVFPTIEVNELEQDPVEIIESEVLDADVDELVEMLREQNKVWNDVDRAVADKDKVVIDFKGFIDEKAFDGGQAQEHELVIGSNAMIPGFEAGIVGKEKGTPFEITVKFPEDYQHAPLAGKEAVFHITIHRILEGALPALDEAFVEQFGIKEATVEALKQDLRDNMVRELEKQLGTMNRSAIFEKILARNAFDVPNALIEDEIKNLQHEMYHRLFGHEHSEHEKIPDFPRVLFESKAKHRVQMGLLFSEYVKKHALEVDEARVDALIEKLAEAYEDPAELREYYKGNKEHREDIQSLVLEEIVAEKMAENAQKTIKKMRYQDVMRPSKHSENQGE